MGVDLLDLWRGRVSPRRVAVLIQGLPPTSATHRSVNGGDPVWGTEHYQLADLFDVMAGVQWSVANKDVPRTKQSPAPAPYPRPGDAKKSRRRTITHADLVKHRERTKRPA